MVSKNKAFYWNNTTVLADLFTEFLDLAYR